jgi:translocation and assembly module TamB
MRRYVAVALVLIVALIGLAAGLAAWLVYTPAGLDWIAAQAPRMTDGALRLEHPTGTLARGAGLSGLHYDSPPLNLRARNVRFRVSALSLLTFAPRILEMEIEVLHVKLQPAEDEPDKPLAIPALPVSVHVDAARVAALEIERAAETLTVDDIFLRYRADSTQHRLDDATLRVRGFSIAAAGTLGTREPYSLNANATVARQTGTPDLNVNVNAEGSLQNLTIRLEGRSAGAHIAAHAEIAPAAALPIANLELRLAALDLRAFDETYPQTALSGVVRLSGASGALEGAVAIENALAGPYDAGRIPVTKLSTDVRTDLAQAHLTDLIVDVSGSGALTGTASLARDEATLALSARGVNLQALHGRLHATQLAGKAQARLSAEQQSVSADLTQADMRLRISAARAADAVTLHEAILHAKGGEANARGKIALGAGYPFDAQVNFRRFDPAAWGDFPQGMINGKMNARGTIQDPSARIDFAVVNSTLRNAPLAGSGQVSVAGSRLTAARFDLRLGVNRADVRGALGGPKDTLRIQLDAPRLATLDPRLGGQIKGEAQLSGALHAPVVRFDAEAAALSAAGVSLERATARGALSGAPAAPLQLDARITGLAAAGRRVKSVAVDLTGSQRSHTAAITATGEGFDILARARGAWNHGTTTWTGTLLEFANRGALEAALEKPVTLSAAPDRVTLGPISMRLLDGRLEADESRYQQGRVSTAGRFVRLPVGNLAAALRFNTPVGGDLRVSGAWSFVQNGTLAGSLNAKRDSGDITLGPDSSLPIQLQALSLEGRIDRGQVQFQASLKSAIASAETSGTIGVVTTGQGARIDSASPLRLTARLAVSELAAVARWVDASLLVGGALNAALSVTGTLGTPAVSGEIGGDRLAFALPPQGVDLKNGSLRAVLKDRSVRVESFSIRGGEGTFSARGTLSLNGAGAMLDWQAERLLLLARPDRRLVVSGTGRAGLVNGNLSLAGGVRVNEGYFEIGEDALPEPGSDVIVIGEKPRPKGDSRLKAMLLELVVTLGDALRVRGRGLDTSLTGEIVVASKPGQDLRAKGTVRTVRGIYTALGQRLEIERGELLFSGPLDNPGLDIRALRKRQAVEAGVEVGGTLNAPVVRIVSDPPVAESEAISWLVLGHGTGDASRGDLAMLPLAASALLRKGDSPSVAQRLGLDTLGLRGAGGENQFLTVGKRIADRLYVAFEQSLGAAESILKLEFDLTERVLLRAQTGEANSLGVFYRYTFD